MEKFVKYKRQSTSMQEVSGLGLEAQDREMDKFIQSQAGELVGEFTDIISGMNVNRPGLKKAIQVCVENDAILVAHNIDRISRDGFRILVELEDKDVKFVDASSPHDSDLVKGIKFAIARDEREKISTRTKNALKSAKLNGVRLGKPENFSQNGREKGANSRKMEAILDPTNKAISTIISLQRKINPQISFQEISDYLNSQGFKSRTGAKFCRKKVQRIYNRNIIA